MLLPNGFHHLSIVPHLKPQKNMHSQFVPDRSMPLPDGLHPQSIVPHLKPQKNMHSQFVPDG